MPNPKQTLAEFAIYELVVINKKLEEMQGYMEKNKLDDLNDRWDSSGKILIATIETQVKSINEVSIKYGQLTEIAARLRKDEEEKMVNVRGATKLSAIDKGLLD